MDDLCPKCGATLIAGADCYACEDTPTLDEVWAARSVRLLKEVKWEKNSQVRTYWQGIAEGYRRASDDFRSAMQRCDDE